MFGSRDILRLWSALLCGLVSVSLSCQRSEPAKAVRPVNVIVSCDTAGWIVPCGCSSKQAGGLLRRASYVKQVAGESDVLLADAGGAPGGTSLYDKLKFEAVLNGEVAMRVAAHNIGAPEAELGAHYLRRLPTRLSAMLVSSNVKDELGEFLVATHRIEPLGSRRVAICGVLSPSYEQAGLQIDDPYEALFRLIPQLKGQYDVLLVLAYLPEQELESLVARLPEADLIVGGPTRQSITPRKSGPTVWGAATNKGKFLVHLVRNSQAGSTWSGKIVELGPEVADDSRQLENLQSFREELAKRDFSADQTSFSFGTLTKLSADLRIAGTEACRQCHQDDCQQWSGTRHGHAWQTLLEKKSHVDPYCQQCHTTGYGLPGGFMSLATGNKRTNVGCESCHGPSTAHTRRPATKTLYDARDRCVHCHDHENSPEFAYARFWEQITHGAASNSVGEK